MSQSAETVPLSELDALPSFARAAELLAADPAVTRERLERLRASAGSQTEP